MTMNQETTTVPVRGLLSRPDQKPFSLALSKEHPSENRAYGFSDDLLVPFAAHFDAVCYHGLYSSGLSYGIMEPCPNVPLFSNCNELFAIVHDETHGNHVLYRQFLHWWTLALVRCILTAGTEQGIHFNLCGYSKERITVLLNRYDRLMKDRSKIAYLTHGDLCERYCCRVVESVGSDKKDDDVTTDSSSGYAYIPHEVFNTAWTPEEKVYMNTCDNDQFPGFTDWDLAFILRDEQLVRKTNFYCVSSVSDLTGGDAPALVPISPSQLKEQYLIDKKQ